MPIPANQMVNIEIIKLGSVAAAGSNSKFSEQILHFRRTSTVPAFNKAHIQSAFHAAIGALVFPCLSVRYTEISESVRCINDPTDQAQVFTVSHAGSIAGDSMPTTMQAFIKKTTGLRGKSYRGSLRLYPLGESQSTIGTDDELNAGALTVFGALASALVAGFADSDGNTWIPQVFSRVLTKKLNALPAVVSADIVSCTVRKTIGHNRHRQVKSVY